MLSKIFISLFLLSQLAAAAQQGCIIYRDNKYTFPYEAITGTNARKTYHYTFKLYNACKEPVTITRITGEQQDSFTISKVLPPQQETALQFQATVYNNGEEFRTSVFTIGLELSDKSNHLFYIQIPSIGGNSKIYRRPDSSIHYAIAQRPDTRFTTALFMHAGGTLQAKGLVQDGDTTLKAGKWEYYSAGRWQIDTVSYSKEMVLSAFNENIPTADNYGKPFHFRVKIREHNQWKEPVTEWRYNGLRFFYTSATDSVVAYTDSLSFGMAINYAAMPSSFATGMYLLKPGVPTLRVGAYTVPFAVVKDTYVLVHYLPPAAADLLYTNLLKKYPGIARVVVGSNQKGIYTGSLPASQKNKLIQDLTADKRIAFISQLYTMTDRQQQGYCNNRVYVKINSRSPEAFKEFAASLGFTDMQADGYSSYHHFVTYKSKWVDEDFFSAFKKLTASPLVAEAYFNSYAEALPDEYMPQPAKRQ